MYKYKVGFIGAGNMGGALAQAVCKTVEPKDVAVSCATLDEAQAVAKRLGCNYDSSNKVVKESKYVFLGVKPQYIRGVADSLISDINDDCVIISMLAGVSIKTLEEIMGNRKIIRIMPNIPCSVGKGMIEVCKNEKVSADELAEFMEFMKEAGEIDEIPETLIDAASAISGCGPAFVYMFAQALADGGVRCGLPRDKALKYAAQTIVGGAEMIMQTGIHPDKLKDAVCSPGGTTIEGVYALEKGAFSADIISAVTEAYKKSKNM